ncbi:hypothetical protein [Serratia surfactantfaciens]|uniref:hypothetical protein n=1 Tax=Serratia surfactantfaciens TaxID=2741499 RepID=UPI001B3CA1B0|nr:hypothetical protein [Serratia surfactantfaciens]
MDKSPRNFHVGSVVFGSTNHFSFAPAYDENINEFDDSKIIDNDTVALVFSKTKNMELDIGYLILHEGKTNIQTTLAFVPCNSKTGAPMVPYLSLNFPASSEITEKYTYTQAVITANTPANVYEKYIYGSLTHYQGGDGDGTTTIVLKCEEDLSVCFGKLLDYCSYVNKTNIVYDGFYPNSNSFVYGALYAAGISDIADSALKILDSKSEELNVHVRPLSFCLVDIDNPYVSYHELESIAGRNKLRGIYPTANDDISKVLKRDIKLAMEHFKPSEGEVAYDTVEQWHNNLLNLNTLVKDSKVDYDSFTVIQPKIAVSGKVG